MAKRYRGPRLVSPLAFARALVYRAGVRPNPGTILYSPTLTIHYAMQGFADGIEVGLAAGFEKKLGSVGPREVGPLMQSAREYPVDAAALRARVEADIVNTYGPRIPEEGGKR